MGELVTADEARRWREGDYGPRSAVPTRHLALTVEVQAWRIAELEAALAKACEGLPLYPPDDPAPNRTDGCVYDCEGGIIPPIPGLTNPSPCPLHPRGPSDA